MKDKIFNWNIVDFFMVTFGTFLACFAINYFIVPNNLYNGGLLGLCQLIRSIIMNTFNVNIKFDISGLLYFFINIPLFILAYKNINKTFLARTVYAVIIQSIFLLLIPSSSKPIVEDLFASIFVGGILSGVGCAIILSYGSSTGGSDIIGLILSKKYFKFSVGKFSLVLNIVIYGITGFIYGIPIMIYSIIYTAICSVAIDKLHLQNVFSSAFIFCKKNPKVINNYIKNELGRDFTYWHAYGGYDDSRTYIIYTALSKYELQRLEKFIKKIDDSIFIVKNENVGINGKFEKYF